jgi:hypothetical protein
MITQELLNYIRLQKQQGVSDETIKRNLLNSNWSEQDINQALLLTGALQPTQAQAPTPPSYTPSSQPQVFTQQVDSTFTVEEEKPKMIKTISTLFFLIAILYIMSTVSMAGIIVIMDRAMGGGDLVFSFLKYFPTFGFIPILFSLVTLVFFFAALKIKNGSRFSFWLGVITLLTLPLPAAFLSQTLMSPFVNLATNLKGGTGENIPAIPFNPANLRFGDSIFILAFIALVLLVISFNKFHFINEPLSKKAKIFLTLLFFLFVLPTLLIVSLGYMKASDTDYGFTKAKSEVSYHIYRPTSTAEGLIPATKFITKKELGGRQDAIQVAYDVPFTELFKEEKPKPIILKQVGVEPAFDLRSYTSQVIKDSSSLQPISLPIAKNQSALLIERKTGDTYVNSVLTYITQDDVLIFITSPYATKERLLQFAESLQ